MCACTCTTIFVNSQQVYFSLKKIVNFSSISLQIYWSHYRRLLFLFAFAHVVIMYPWSIARFCFAFCCIQRTWQGIPCSRCCIKEVMYIKDKQFCSDWRQEIKISSCHYKYCWGNCTVNSCDDCVCLTSYCVPIWITFNIFHWTDLAIIHLQMFAMLISDNTDDYCLKYVKKLNTNLEYCCHCNAWKILFSDFKINSIITIITTAIKFLCGQRRMYNRITNCCTSLAIKSLMSRQEVRTRISKRKCCLRFQCCGSHYFNCSTCTCIYSFCLGTALFL